MSKYDLLLSEIKRANKAIDELKRQLKSDVLNTKDAAEYLGMSVSTFRKMTQPSNMLIRSFSNGRNRYFLKKDLLQFITDNLQKLPS